MNLAQATAARRRQRRNEEKRAEDTREMKNLSPEGKYVIPSAPPVEEVPEAASYPEDEEGFGDFEVVEVPTSTREELLDSMPLDILKRLMDRYSVSYQGCTEKKEFVSRAAQNIDIVQLSAFLDDLSPPSRSIGKFVVAFRETLRISTAAAGKKERTIV